jgi:outer membrane protein OmpA-like peptidoglycan-associated protein
MWRQALTALAFRTVMLAGVMLTVALAPSALALTYGARMDEAEWIVDSSIFQCTMRQPIPLYGEAVFTTRAGEREEFSFHSVPTPMSSGQAVLVSGPPVWKPGMKRVPLGNVPVTMDEQPIRLGAAQARQLLAELEKGKAPRFTRMSWFGRDEQIEVEISSVNFRDSYRIYRQCQTALLPVNFEQIRRTRVQFEVDKWDITPAAKKRLDMIVLYAKADREVNSFYVDGHTDDTHTRVYNLELSKKRAEAVSQYLIKAGLSEDAITVRYHGERYPLVPNRNAANRAVNRRVTIRLEKE